MYHINDTICAIATSAGHGAIALVRISGPKAIEIIDTLVVFPKKNKKLVKQHANTVHFAKILDNDDVIDEVLITLFKNPHSYTGQDLIEIGCHGSTFIQQHILNLLLTNGARLANAGEFTQRAFLAGKMDLSQAEAVADLIAGESKAAHTMAMNQMRGGFSHQINALRNRLLNFISLIELELDFSEEDVEFANRAELTSLVNEILSTIVQLSDSFRYGNAIKNGIPVAIVGKPNVGKSTLLNALLNEEKAIVSEIPGTTRDVIEDVIHINGMLFRFIDTAGIRETTDTIETLGIERTFDNIRKATVILYLVNADDRVEDIEKEINKIEINLNQSIALIINKIDKFEIADIKNKFNIVTFQKFEKLYISAKHKQHINSVQQYLSSTTAPIQKATANIIVSNARHYKALQATHTAGNRVITGIEQGMPVDLVAQDIREMLYHLGSITGEITTDEILGNIFKNFCIGK